jgi:acetyltransferase-like isoleucine patch superfamily enzyme
MTAAMLAAIGDCVPKVGGHTFEYIHVHAGRWRTVMLLEHIGAVPKIDPTARIAPNAVLCGQVTIGANSSIGFGAVLSAEKHLRAADIGPAGNGTTAHEV